MPGKYGTGKNIQKSTLRNKVLIFTKLCVSKLLMKTTSLFTPKEIFIKIKNKYKYIC